MLNILKKTKGWKLPALALAGLIFAVFTVMGNKPAPAKEPVVMPPASPYTDAVAGIGVVEPKSETIAIGTELPGVVRSVFVNVGDAVKAGDPLFTLDERDINAQIKTLEATLAATKVQSDDAKAQFAIVQSIGDKRAVAKDDVNRRKFAALFAQSKIDEITAQLEQARTTKERLTVRAPLDGQILSVNVRAGEFASAGALSEPLMRMGDTSTLHVRVEIDEENSRYLKEGLPAKGSKRGEPSAQWPLTFVRFEPFVKAKQNLAVAGQRVDTRVIQVIYAIDTKDASVFVGQQMDVFINKGNDHAP